MAHRSLALVLLALAAAPNGGCCCTCTDRILALVDPGAEAAGAAAAAYVAADPQAKKVFGTVESARTERALCIPLVHWGEVGDEEAASVDLVVDCEAGDARATVLLVRRAGAWVALGATLVAAGETVRIGEEAELERHTSDDVDWD